MSGGASTAAGTGWPARIIHVNEDGWVLVNRGSAQGVAPGLRLLVVTQGTRELRDLYRDSGGAASGPVVLRVRRTFELLEVIQAERDCAIAIAARVPVERRPTVFHGQDGELLVWVPLPADYAYPQSTPAADDGDEDEEDTPADTGATPDAEASDRIPASADPEGSVAQEDELWEQSLPLNGLHVGDWVLPALPATPQGGSSGAHTTITGETRSSTTTNTGRGDAGQPYDWMTL